MCAPSIENGLYERTGKRFPSFVAFSTRSIPSLRRYENFSDLFKLRSHRGKNFAHNFVRVSKYEKSIFEIITLETRNLEFQEKDRSLELLWSRLCLRLWTRKNIGRRGDWLSCQVAKLVHSTNETNIQRARFDKKEERKEKERENNWKIIVSRF